MGDDDGEIEGLLRSELCEWDPRRGPDLRDLMRRAERHQPWRAPVALASAVAAAALAAVFLLSIMLVLLSPAIPAAENVRAHLVGALP